MPSLMDFIRKLFSMPAEPAGSSGDAGIAAPITAYPDSPFEPAQITNPKVLLVVCNPVIQAASKRRIAATMGWTRPDDLVGRFIAEVLQASGGLARYQIADRVEMDEFPALADGFHYTPDSYLEVARRAATPHAPFEIDYHAILERFDVLRRVDHRELDEVWVVAFPHAGLYESVMAGTGAFWCNAPPLRGTESCKRRFVIMGFSFERDVGEMLHSYNHRSEAILAKVFNCLDFLAWTYNPNRVPVTVAPDQPLGLFERYILFDKIAPGRAAMGSVHYAPNGQRDYDLGNPRPVRSECYDWLTFPSFRGDVRMVSASEWGGGPERGFQRWWMNHLPKTAGRKNGIHNNWWQYVANLDNVID